jgi:hypothetical protein
MYIQLRVKIPVREVSKNRSLLATRKAIKNDKIENEPGNDHPLDAPLSLLGVVPGASKKEPGPSCEGPGMISSVVPGAWA